MKQQPAKGVIPNVTQSTAVSLPSESEFMNKPISKATACKGVSPNVTQSTAVSLPTKNELMKDYLFYCVYY